MASENHNSEKDSKKIGRSQIILGGICVAAACAAGAALSLRDGQVPPSQESMVMEPGVTSEQDMEESTVEKKVTEPQEEYAASDLTEEKTEQDSTEAESGTEMEPGTEAPKYDTDIKIVSITLSVPEWNLKRQIFFDKQGGIIKDKFYYSDDSVEEREYFQDADGNAVLMLVTDEAWLDNEWFDDSFDKSVDERYAFCPCIYDNGYSLDENGCYVETSSYGDRIAFDGQNRIIEDFGSDDGAVCSTYKYEDGYILIDEHSSDQTEFYGQTRFDLNDDGYVTCYYDNSFSGNYGDNCWMETYYTRNEQNKWITKKRLLKNDNGAEIWSVEEREFDSQGRLTKYETDGEDEVDYLVYSQDGQLEKVEKVIKTLDGAVREAQNTYTYDEYGRVVRETVQTWSNIKDHEEVPYYMVEEEFTVTYNEKGFPVEIHEGELIGSLVKGYYDTTMQQVLDARTTNKGQVTYITYEYDYNGGNK